MGDSIILSSIGAQRQSVQHSLRPVSSSSVTHAVDARSKLKSCCLVEAVSPLTYLALARAGSVAEPCTTCAMILMSKVRHIMGLNVQRRHRRVICKCYVCLSSPDELDVLCTVCYVRCFPSDHADSRGSFAGNKLSSLYQTLRHVLYRLGTVVFQAFPDVIPFSCSRKEREADSTKLGNRIPVERPQR